MLLVSRRVGEALTIEDVRLLVVQIGSDHVDVSLQKQAGGTIEVATLGLKNYVDLCYDVQGIVVSIRDDRARLGLEGPREIRIVLEDS